MSVGCWVGWSVCHDFLKGREVMPSLLLSEHLLNVYRPPGYSSFENFCSARREQVKNRVSTNMMNFKGSHTCVRIIRSCQKCVETRVKNTKEKLNLSKKAISSHSFYISFFIISLILEPLSNLHDLKINTAKKNKHLIL